MNQPKIKLTKKLFHKKWAYKAVFSAVYAHRISRFGVDHTKNWCNSTNVFYHQYGVYRDPDPADLVQLGKLATLMSEFISEDTKLHGEHNKVHLYFNDETMLPKMQESLSEFLVEIWQPENERELQIMKNNTNSVICNEYPYGLYKYKVILKPSMPDDTRKSFREWEKKYDYTVICPSPSTISWLDGYSLWASPPFIYVNDNSTLMMFLLFVGEYVSRIEEFILKPADYVLKSTV